MRRPLLILGVMFILLAAFPSAAADDASSQWHLEVAGPDEYVFTKSTSIATDGEGSVHIVSADDNAVIRYARRYPDGNWDVTYLNDYGSGSRAYPMPVHGCSVVLDSGGSYHIVFHDGQYGNLRYMYEGASMSTAITDQLVGGPYSSLAIDDEDRLHISYFDRGANKLMYGTKPPDGRWSFEEITMYDFNVTGRTAIALGPDGRVHVLYTANYHTANPYPYQDMHYVYRNTDGTWAPVMNRITSMVEGPFSMTIDQEGGVHIAFTMNYWTQATVSYDVRVYYGHLDESGEWTFRQPFEEGYMGRFPSIAVDPEGVVHISGHCEIHDALKYYHRTTDGTWRMFTLEDTNDTGRHTSLVLDASGQSHIAYYDYHYERVKYATNAHLPSAPRDLVGVPGVNRVSLSWKPPLREGFSPVDHYTLYRLGPHEGDLLEITLDGPGTNYIDTGLLAGEQYVYYVTASNSFGESLPSDSIRVIPLAPTQTVLPWAPWDLEAVGGDGHVNLSWAPPRNADEFTITGYRIYWLSQKWTAGGLHYVPPLEGSYWSIVDVQGTSTSYTHEGLTNGEEYYYHVSALTPVGEGDVSPYVSATPLALPSAPWGLWGTLRVGEIYIHWEPPVEIGDVGIFTYKVLRGETPDDMGPLVDLDWTWWDWGLYEFPPNEYTDEDLGGHEFWYYQVIAVNRLGEGPPSEIVRVPPAPEPPTAPRDLEATPNENVIELLWRAPVSPGTTSIDGYFVYRWREGEERTIISEVDVTHLGFIDNDVERGRVYFYAVSAMSSVGEGSLSNEVNTILLGSDPEDPGSPGGPAVEASSFLVGDLGMFLLLVVVVLCFVVSTLYLRTR